MRTEKRVAKLLRRAADHMERVGLHKNHFYAGMDDLWEDTYGHGNETLVRLGHNKFKNAPCCAYGALYACSSSPEDVEDAAIAMIEGIRQRNSTYEYYDLPDWNDMKGRRKAHVVNAFRRAADNLEGKVT